MVETDELYCYADSQGIAIDRVPMNYAEALSVPVGNGAVAIDPFRIRSFADEKVKLAHELGHCATGSFYNRYSPFDVVGRHERRADKWAIKKLVPKDELDAAVSSGHVEVWDLADYFGVTEGFIRKAVRMYRNCEI